MRTVGTAVRNFESGVNNEDGLIGAVADRFDEPVLTDNVDDFRTLGVAYETYEESCPKRFGGGFDQPSSVSSVAPRQCTL